MEETSASRKTRVNYRVVYCGPKSINDVTSIGLKITLENALNDVYVCLF